MPRIDLTDPAERAKAVLYGYIWQAPQGAIEAALQDIADGTIPPPDHIPQEWVALAQSYGVEVPAAPDRGMMP